MFSAMPGLIVPIAILSIQGPAENSKFSYPIFWVEKVFWPSSFWLMATEGIERTPLAYFFVSVSIVANMVVYSALGCFLWGIKLIINFVKAAH